MKYEAISLFVERAQTVAKDLKLFEAQAGAVAEICRRLDGIPLAIELAAARVRLLNPGQIAGRLSDVFHLLSDGNRTALPRHRTLRALIDWSYDLLSAEERILLGQLSVFLGSWTLEAVEGICSAPASVDHSLLDLLNQLVDKSLVQAIPCDTGSCRFRMLETIRLYAQEKLERSNQRPATRDRHLAYYLALAQGYERLLRTEKIYELLELLDLELDNLRAAITWAISKSDSAAAEKAFKIINALFYFWYLRSLFSEIDGWIKQAMLFLAGDDPQAAGLKAWSLLVLALLKSQYGEFAPEVIEHLNTCIRLYRQSPETLENRMRLALALAERKAIVYINLDVPLAGQGYHAQDALRDGEESLAIARDFLHAPDPESGWFVSWIYWTNVYADSFGYRLLTPDLQASGKNNQYLQTALDISTRQGDQVSQLMILMVFTAIYRYDDIKKCRIYAKQGIALSERLGDRKSLADILCHQGIACYLSRQFQEMGEIFREVYQIGCQVGDEWHEIYGVRMQGFAAVLQGDGVKASAFLEKALRLSSSHQDTYGRLSACIGICGLALLLDQTHAAARLLGFVERQMENVLKTIIRMDQMEIERIAAGLKEKLGEADYAELWAEGREMVMEDAIQEAYMIAKIDIEG